MKVNQLKWGTILSYLSLGMGTLVSLLYTPILLRYLGETEYGLYNYVLPIITWLTTLTFGMGSAYTRYYSEYKTKNDVKGMAKLNGMFLTIFSIIGLVILILGMIITWKAKWFLGKHIGQMELAQKLMFVLTINAALSVPISVFESNVMINEQYIFQKLIAMAKSVLNPLVMIPLLLLGFRSIALVIVTLSFTIVSGILNIYYCFKKLSIPISFKHFDFSLMKEMVGFTWYVFIGIIVNELNWGVDKFIIGRIHGEVPVAIYSQASQLNLYFLSISTALSSVLTPKIHRMVRQECSNDELTALFTKTGRLQFIFMSMVFFGYLAVGRPFTILWSNNSDKFEISYYIAVILFLSTIIPAIQEVGIEIQRAKNMHKFRSIVYLCVAIANIGLSIPLTTRWQGLGASIGTLISILLGNVLLMNWYYYKKIGLNIPAFWKQICSMLPALILPAIVSIVTSILVPNHSILGILIGGCIFVAVFIPSMWLLGMNNYEKSVFLEPIHKIQNKFKKS